MRSSSWSSIVGAAAIALTIRPPDVYAADVHATVGIPKVLFAATGASLVRHAAIAIDNDSFAVDASTAICVSTSFGAPTVNGAAPGCAAGVADASNSLAEHSTGVTLKLPQLDRGMPYVDLSIRNWSGGASREASRSATHGLAAEAQIIRAIGAYELSAGYSHPLTAADGWRVAWAGAAVRIGDDTLLHLSYESAHDALTGARDNRYALRVTRAIGDAMRATAYVTHAPDDFERPWHAGAGIEWTF